MVPLVSSSVAGGCKRGVPMGLMLQSRGRRRSTVRALHSTEEQAHDECANQQQ